MSEHNVTDTSLKRTIMILLKLKQEQISKLQRRQNHQYLTQSLSRNTTKN